MKEYLESYSNLAYNLIGFAGLVPPFVDMHGITFCMLMQAMGVASFTYHWYKTKPMYLFDWWAMMYVVTIMAAHVVNTPLCWFAVFLYQVAYGFFLMGRFPDLSIKGKRVPAVYLEIGLVIVPCLVAIWIKRGFMDFAVLFGLILVALYIRSKDPDPTQSRFHDSIEHSIWHVLTAPVFFIGWFGIENILNV